MIKIVSKINSLLSITFVISASGWYIGKEADLYVKSNAFGLSTQACVVNRERAYYIHSHVYRKSVC